MASGGHGGSCMNDEVIGAMVTCSGDTTTTTTTTTTMSGSSTTGASVGAAHGYGASACFASLALLAALWISQVIANGHLCDRRAACAAAKLVHKKVGMAPPELGTLFYVEEAKYKAEKALIAAKFTGSALQTKKFDPQKDAKKPDFLAKNPTGKVPYLETEKGCIFTSNAVARYVARSRGDLGLYGDSFDEEGSVDTWLDFCLHEVEVPLMAWVYPVLGMMEEVPSATKDAQEDVKKALKVMEGQLATSAFLVGDSVTLADIALVCALKEGFKRVFDSNFRKPFPKTCQWFEKCCKMQPFKAVLGEVALCTAPEKPRAVLPAFAPPAREKGDKKAEKPAEKKADAKPAEKKAAAKPSEKAAAKPAEKAAAKPSEKAAAKPAEKAAAKPAEKAAAKAPGQANGASSGDADLEAKITDLGNQIRTKKEQLKAQGLSGKKADADPEVKAMVEQLQQLKGQR
ncbi:unnamed protein product [Effrenium voratum]|uniref:Uncharacterized protein n=1 Tax=Effrenium voratum TaxID=2562239 RepID=A0AA36I980_9DINO|nr:unnamed protein product [Effrenium voratum]